MDIQKLLNPSCRNIGIRRNSQPVRITETQVSPTTVTRRQKIAKDAPIFSEGNRTVGNVNFPPYEVGDDYELAKQHLRFQIYPTGDICRKGIRHVPYNSDKKDFMEKTGRDAFESKSPVAM